jgi:hypothetical protein
MTRIVTIDLHVQAIFKNVFKTVFLLYDKSTIFTKQFVFFKTLKVFTSTA